MDFSEANIWWLLADFCNPAVSCYESSAFHMICIFGNRGIRTLKHSCGSIDGGKNFLSSLIKGFGRLC